MTDAMSLVGVTKTYNDVTAVRDVSLSVARGEALGILGPSGAGKSTMLRLMDLLESPTEGSVYINQRKMVAESNAAVAERRRMGMILQKPVVLNRSVTNNLAYALMIRGADREAIQGRIEQELRRFGLYERRNKNARTLSGGEMQRLCFARAMLHEPQMLLLDEFAANLDPANVAMLEDSIRRFTSEDRQRSVVLVTHNMFQARRMCDRIAFMWNGELIEVAYKADFFERPSDERTAAFVRGDLVY
jgi:tungstate transport system ATP-binding protein